MPDQPSTAPLSSWRGILSAPRTVYTVGLVLFAFTLASLFSSLVQSRTALITADPYSYLLFARELADGHLHMTGPLAEAIAHFADNDDLMEGPIWNTHVLPDGRTIFTIALGYPLFLSMALLLGGTWLYTEINVLLLLLVVLVLTWCVWEAWDRRVTGFLVGAAASILFVHSQPATFLQFSHPWREPLFYLCVLGGIGGLTRFVARGRLVTLIPAGLLLGYACAIKEANAIYTVWLGLCFLASGTWRHHPRRMTALTVFMVCGVLGVAPLLIQNLAATGSPLLSTQFMRATSNYGAQEVAAGLNSGNMGSTFSRYILLYKLLPAFHPVLLVMAVIGVLSSLKRPAMRMFLGVFVVHLALYLQWGNADFRHSFFAHIPYSLFVIAGLTWLLQVPFRWLRDPAAFRSWAALVPLIALSALPAPWHARQEPESTFAHRHAVGLVDALDEHIDDGGILLANRVLRDVVGVYGDGVVIRLHDLAAFHPAGDYAEVINWLEERGHPVYFVDNRDLDPKNSGRIRWDKLDYRMLLHHFDLAPTAILDSRALHIQSMTAGEPLTFYTVDAWKPGPYRRVLPVPDSGAAFLFLNPRAATDLVYTLNGAPFVPDAAAGFYQPVPPFPPGSEVVFEWSGPPSLPSLHDLRLVSATEDIHQECAADSLPSDLPFFPQGGFAPEPENCRRFLTPLVMRIPIRQALDRFTTIGLGLNLIERTNANVFASMPGGEPMPIKISSNAAWFPAVLPEHTPPVARSVDIALSADVDADLKLTRIKSIIAHRRLSRPRASNELGVALAGRIVPDVPGEGPHAWSAAASSGQTLSGRGFDDPRRTLNTFHYLFTGEGVGPADTIEFAGCGLMQARWMAVTDRLSMQPGSAAVAFVDHGLGPVERVAGPPYCWSEPGMQVRVPVGGGVKSYRLTLRVADGHPEIRRTLRIAFAKQSREILLPQTPEDLTLYFDAPETGPPRLAEVHFDIPPWSPRELLGYDDDRRLGFIFYRLSWEPAE